MAQSEFADLSDGAIIDLNFQQQLLVADFFREASIVTSVKTSVAATKREMGATTIRRKIPVQNIRLVIVRNPIIVPQQHGPVAR